MTAEEIENRNAMFKGVAVLKSEEERKILGFDIARAYADEMVERKIDDNTIERFNSPLDLNRKNFPSRKAYRAYLSKLGRGTTALDKHNERLASAGIRANGTIKNLHPTKGYRKLSDRRLQATLKTHATALAWSRIADRVAPRHGEYAQLYDNAIDRLAA
jgi:hypothetical protein